MQLVMDIFTNKCKAMCFYTEVTSKQKDRKSKSLYRTENVNNVMFQVCIKL